MANSLLHIFTLGAFIYAHLLSALLSLGAIRRKAAALHDLRFAAALRYRIAAPVSLIPVFPLRAT
jgi:hypothetical protein